MYNHMHSRAFQFFNLSYLILQRLSAHLLQQLRLDLIKLVRKIHINLMRIDQTFGLIPESLFFSGTDVTDLHDRRRRINTFTVLKYRNQKLS